MTTLIETQIRELELVNDRWLMARKVLGSDFVAPAEIMHHRPDLSYSGQQQQRLGTILPAQAELEWCREQGMFLVPGPGDEINVATLFAASVRTKLRQVAPDACLEPISWLALTKHPLSDSFSLGWQNQTKMLVEPMVTPSLLEILWAVWVYRTVRHRRLLKELYVRATPTMVVGYAESLRDQRSVVGLHIDTCWDQDQASNLGLLGVRRFLEAN